MNSHNPKTTPVTANETAGTVAESERVRVIRSSANEAVTLSISQDSDRGGDPYNSTGQHVIIKANIELQD